MIIFGYPGIGKTTCYEEHKDMYIDLDSYMFDKNIKNGWIPTYFKLAETFSELGRDVFVSTHQEVIDYFIDHSKQRLVLIYPDEDLIFDWIDRLYYRYKMTELESDKKAYNRVFRNYLIDVKTFDRLDKKDNLYRIKLNSKDYILNDVIQEFKVNINRKELLEKQEVTVEDVQEILRNLSDKINKLRRALNKSQE